MTTTLDLSQCDKEPIHIPGAIQPFGALVICKVGSGEIEQISTNAEEVLGVSNIVGKSIADVKARIEPERCVHSCHRIGELDYYEFEAQPQSDAADWNEKTRAAMQAMQTHSTWQGFLDESARQIQLLTGYDRVMVYQFHADQHGEVVAEVTNPGVESYMGLHYPASDIPAPARRVFLENWVRMIPTVNYAPVPFQPALHPRTGQTPDLSRTLARSVSPIHLEYLRNMEVGATLTLSILSEGKLWGLVACHHRQPKLMDSNARAACEILARYLSGLLRDIARVQEFTESEKLRDIHRRIISRLEPDGDLGRQLTQESPNLLDLIRSDGAAVALHLEGEWQTVGPVPSEEQLDELVEWLASSHSDEAVFHTASLSRVFAPAESYAEIGSGLLAISIPKTRRNYVLMFRPEIELTVRWAGKPETKTTTTDGRLHPRTSFSEWREQVRHTSQPWRPWEIDAGLELRAALLGLDLRRQFQKEQKARHEAEIAIKLREELMAVLSHDLKNPIGSILLQAQLMERSLVKSEDKKMLEGMKRIARAGNNMNNLINDILHVTKLESGTMKMSVARESLHAVLQDALDMLSPLAANNQLELRLKSQSDTCMVKVDRDRVEQVISNLIGNAVKFTPPGGVIEVSIERCGPENAVVAVSDTGPGIPPEHHEFIFDRFWQANQARRLGTGLGLAICKGIINAHGGSIWVENGSNGGSIFKFTLPLA